MKPATISLSFRRLALAQLAATIVAAVVWGSGVMLGGFGMQIALEGVSQIGVLLVISFVFLVLFGPSRERPVATAATLWSVTSFARFLASLGASSLLYYAAQFGVRPLLFSFLLTAVLLLICETRVIAHDISNISTLTKE